MQEEKGRDGEWKSVCSAVVTVPFRIQTRGGWLAKLGDGARVLQGFTQFLPLSTSNKIWLFTVDDTSLTLGPNFRNLGQEVMQFLVNGSGGKASKENMQ